MFINAHLACNYTNKVAVVASHCNKAHWLYPTSSEQKRPRTSKQKRQSDTHDASSNDQLAEPTKRLKLNGPQQNGTQPKQNSNGLSGHKYRPFHLVEEEMLSNLKKLLTATSPAEVQSSTTTMIAGALTLALSYINRESIAYAESKVGLAASSGVDQTTNPGGEAGQSSDSNTLRSRILLISASPSTDLAHQYIPIMNAIFACQRLSIPIDILQLPIRTLSSSSDSTVFLQQAADATHGIFIPAQLAPTNNDSNDVLKKTASQAFLTYLLTAFLPDPTTRHKHLVLPTRIDVDFRAACFCHRRIVSTGFVCSICLSIFCEVPPNAECLTCGTHLTLAADYGKRPVVVSTKKKKKRKDIGARATPSRVGTPS